MIQRVLNRFQPVYNDMLGKVQSAASGGTAWDTEVITGTVFIIGALKDNSTDLVQVSIQVPHGRKLTTALASIHIHYALQAASTADETIVFTGKYCWVQPGGAIPIDASWTAMSGAGLTLVLGNYAVRYYGIHTIQANIACPAGAGEGYGGMLLIHITRGDGTHTGKLAILDVDAHSQFDRLGSANETSD
jgi:hypothetical protein